jgi:hypothetical protein
MTIARETVYSVLFELLTPLLAPGATPSSPGNDAQPGTPTADQPFNLVSREVIEVNRVPPGLQPVLFMDEVLEEEGDDGQGLPYEKWNLLLHVGVTSSKGTPAAPLLNPLIDLVLAAIGPAGGDDIQALGLAEVDSVRVMGAIVKNLGQNSTSADCRQAVAYIPIQILLPSIRGASA